MSRRGGTKKPPADEARGRKFQRTMENTYQFEELTVKQADAVLRMAERLQEWMKHRRKE